ncbi:MAG: ATP-binding cassette domain-containing protein [Candidatus Melainabacteria bacterium]|nr:ATP-binding cassette domain-containing protein [Candidatus Melainabacteria bacterium]
MKERLNQFKKLSTRETIIETKSLTKHFPVQHGFWSRTTNYVQATNNINLQIEKGQIIGIVGESGCGKSTLGKLILRLLEPTLGEVLYKGINIHSLSNKELKKLREKLQIVFQNPYSSLNPRMKIQEIISEPILVHKIITNGGKKEKVRERVLELLSLVGLEDKLSNKYAHELSGGQRQRVAIARALALNPEFLILDEPVSALDVSVQAQILNLLLDLQKKLNLTYLFISHNLSVVSYISTHIAVMYLGHIVEIGQKELVINNPQHPYTVALLSAAPRLAISNQQSAISNKIVLSGEIPDPSNPPSGCVFRTRCPIARDKCSVEVPLLIKHNAQLVACHYGGELKENQTIDYRL